MPKGLKRTEQVATAGLETSTSPFSVPLNGWKKDENMDSTERKFTVYMHTSPNGKKYIGITCQDVDKRWGSNGTGYRRCTYFGNAIKKYGWDNIQHDVLSEGLTEAEAKQCEKDLIVEYKTRDPSFGYNMTDGGDGLCGCIRSEATRAKIRVANLGRKESEATRAAKRAALLGNKNGLGYRFTEISRAKCSAAKLGHEVSEETRAKLSAALLGRKLSDSAREKLMGNQNSLGYKHTAKTKQKQRDAKNLLSKDVERLTMDGKVVARYFSLVDAEEKTGIHKSGICQVCLGRRKTAGKFRWRYV